eukprot:jgi/Galph1/2309/GphlegSOOS_G1011.1
MTNNTQTNDRGGTGKTMPSIPPDLEKIIDKTATYAAKNGPSFEARVFEMNRNNPKFSFLLESDPLHHYYVQRLTEEKQLFASSVHNETNTSSLGAQVSPPQAVGESVAEAAPAVSKAKLSERKEQAARPVPTEPPPEDVFTANIPEEPLPSAVDIEIMKLTAQFIARNGRSFLHELNAREYRNPQFEFLKPIHPYFTFFQRLVDAYSAVIAPDEPLLSYMKQGAYSFKKVMNDLYYRVDWEVLQEERKTEQNRSELEKIQMQMIDWHDFVVVETIQLNDNETNLPAPVKSTSNLAYEWQRRESAMDGYYAKEDEGAQDMDMEMDTQEEEVEVNAYSDIPVDKIRKDYKPRVSLSEESNSLQVALPSGQKVPLHEANKSIKMELLDPKYKEERQRAAEKNKYQNLASDAEVAMNLGRLSDQKVDIYNRADLQNVVAERRVSEYMTNNNSINNDAVTFKAPQVTVQGKASSFLLEQGMNEQPDKQANSNGIPPNLSESEMEVESSSDVGIQVHVRVQSHPNQEWNLKGQTISLQVPYQATILDLKTSLSPLVKLAPNKQKMSVENYGYLKDNLSLGDYQFYDGVIMFLEVKERGGKKK